MKTLVCPMYDDDAPAYSPEQFAGYLLMGFGPKHAESLLERSRQARRQKELDEHFQNIKFTLDGWRFMTQDLDKVFAEKKAWRVRGCLDYVKTHDVCKATIIDHEWPASVTQSNLLSGNDDDQLLVRMDDWISLPIKPAFFLSAAFDEIGSCKLECLFHKNKDQALSLSSSWLFPEYIGHLVKEAGVA